MDNYWKMHTATVILKRENPTLSEINEAKETLLALIAVHPSMDGGQVQRTYEAIVAAG